MYRLKHAQANKDQVMELVEKKIQNKEIEPEYPEQVRTVLKIAAFE